MVALDICSTFPTTGFHHIGIESALNQETNRGSLWCFSNDFGFGLFEDANEFPADDLALGFRIGNTGQMAEELLGGVNRLQFYAGGVDKVALNLLDFAFFQFIASPFR